jgi:hypothetical protein
VEGPGRGCVGELADGIRDPAPDRHAAVIAGGCELVDARGAFLERFLAVALEHQGGGAPDVDLGNHTVRFPRAGRRLQAGATPLEPGALARHLLCESPPLRNVVPHHAALVKAKRHVPHMALSFFPACWGHDLERGMNPAARVQLGRVTPARGVAFAKSPGSVSPTPLRTFAAGGPGGQPLPLSRHSTGTAGEMPCGRGVDAGTQQGNRRARLLHQS